MESITMQLAQEELNKYLEIMSVRAEISLGLFEDFGITLQVKDPVFDDAIAISVKNKKGYVAGSNERSVLMAVYRLLKEWGIYWVRPGKNGTYIPKECKALDVEILEKASKRHRTMCIEGAVSLENVLDMIEWLPKVGFNGYYIQFSNPYNFFDRWYNHERNPYVEPEGLMPEQTERFREIMVSEIKKRGLMLHVMGHGWTCIPFGIPDNGWYAYESEDFPQDYKDICAMVNGERKVWNNTPLAGQLCYSNPYVRKTMADSAVQYVKDHPEADVVYFWLGDYFNNTCECPECTRYYFSDYYIRILNDITDALVTKGLKTKIVFSIGYNKYQPPIAEKILNTDNLMLMFGKDAVEELCAYFEELSYAFDIGAIRSFKDIERSVFIDNMKAAIAAMERAKEMIDRHQQEENPCHKESWMLLKLHREIYLALGKSILAKLLGDVEEGQRYHEQAIQFAWKNEDKLQAVLDCMFFDEQTKEKINLDGVVEFKPV